MTSHQDAIVNRVASSGLLTIDLEAYYPQQSIASFDLKDFLFQGLILREKEFRNALAAYDWSTMRDKLVAVFCSADAIVPVWAYMLVTVYLQPVAAAVFFCRPDQVIEQYYDRLLNALDVTGYANQRVIIKGCSHKPVPASAYARIAERLRPVARSIMYGEACSNVPVYKAKKAHEE